MTLLQETFADAILEAHRDNKGVLNWSAFLGEYIKELRQQEEISDREMGTLYRVVSAHLLELKLIRFREGQRITKQASDVALISELTAAGYVFESFKSLREKREMKEMKDAERQRLNDEKLKYDLKNVKRVYKTYWITFFFAIVGFAYALSQLFKALMK